MLTAALCSSFKSRSGCKTVVATLESYNARRSNARSNWEATLTVALNADAESKQHQASSFNTIDSLKTEKHSP